MAEIWDPEVELDASDAHVLDLKGVYRGADAARQFLQEWFSAWGTLDYDYEPVDAGERVVMLLDLQMRGRSTGIETSFGKFAWVSTFTDGLVVHAKLYMEPVGSPRSLRAPGVVERSASSEAPRPKFAGSRAAVASIRGRPEHGGVPFNRVVSGGIALAVGCLLVFSAPATAGPKVAAVQVALKRLGLYNATVDGIRGPLTKAAIVTFQRRRGLAVDGVVGPQTRAAFGKRGRPAFGSRTMKRGDRGWDVAAMQYILARRGYPPGAIDAVFGPMTDTALRNFQRAFGLSADGLAGPMTIAALRRGRASRGTPGTTTPVSGPVRLLRPVPGPIGDRFGAPRKGKRTHTGIDFPVQAGTEVHAAGVGVTEFAGRNTGGYGNLVVVRHRLGYTTWYAHLSIITTRVGERVTGGTRLGYVGSTGNATGPHLHFELRRNAVPVDPVPYLLAAVARRASIARAASGGGGVSVENGGGEGDTSRSGDTGSGGVAARACPIREPLVRYRRAPLDACKAKNLTPAR